MEKDTVNREAVLSRIGDYLRDLPEEELVSVLSDVRDRASVQNRKLRHPQEQKYGVTDITEQRGGVTVHQIVALKDFCVDVKNPAGDLETLYIRKGQLGGFIQSEDNLSQKGDCWVTESAAVFGESYVGGSAVVTGHALVMNNASVLGNATVSEGAVVCGHAVVAGNAVVTDSAVVDGPCTVRENACIMDGACVNGWSVVGGSLCVAGRAHITDCKLSGCGNITHDMKGTTASVEKDQEEEEERE